MHVARVMAKKTTRTAKKTAKKSAKAATSTSAKRELLNTGRDARYAKRTTGGRFADMDDVGRSQKTDKAKKAKTAVRSGYGDQGDRRPAKKR